MEKSVDEIKKTQLKKKPVWNQEIKSLFEQFEQSASEYEGIECWSARELQNLLGYSKW